MEENDKPKKHTTVEERIELWVDLVRDVKDHLPVDSKSAFIKLCLVAFEKNGYKDRYENPFFITEDYANPRWTKIINETAYGKDGVFIKFVRERDKNGFKGQWQVVNKREYIKEQQRAANDLQTRIENYTYNVELAQGKWKGIQMPLFEVKQLPG